MPFHGMLLGASIMGLADGPTEVHKVTVARQVLREHRPSDDLWPTKHLPKRLAAARAKYAEHLEHEVGEPVIDVERLTAWLDDEGLPGTGEPDRDRVRLRRHARTRSTRSGAATCTPRCASRRPTAPGDARRRDPPRVAHHRGARRHRRAPHAGHRRLHGHRRARAQLLPDGVRRRLVADERRRLAGALRHRPGRPPGPGLRARRGHRPALEGRLAGEGAAATSAGPTASTSARSTGGPPSSSASRAASCPGFDEAAAWLRAHKPIDFVPGLMHGDYQFANVMYRHGGPARLAAIVDWEMGTVGDPKLDLGWVVQSWPEDTSSGDGDVGGYVDMTGMPSQGPGARPLRRGVRPPGRRHRLLRRPRQVEARRRARAGLPARRRRREAAGLRPRRARPDARRRPSWRRPRTTAPDVPAAVRHAGSGQDARGGRAALRSGAGHGRLGRRARVPGDRGLRAPRLRRRLPAVAAHDGGRRSPR